MQTQHTTDRAEADAEERRAKRQNAEQEARQRALADLAGKSLHDLPPTLTVAVVAALGGCVPRTVRRGIASGALHPIKIRRRVLLHRDEVLRWLGIETAPPATTTTSRRRPRRVRPIKNED